MVQDTRMNRAPGEHCLCRHGATIRTGSVDGLFAEMASRYDDLPRQLKLIAQFIESNRTRMAVTPITTIASTCGVQPSAVTRFAQRFGFSGYSEIHELFRVDFNAAPYWLGSHAKRPRQPVKSSCRPNAAGALRQVLLANLRSMEELTLGLDHRSLRAAATTLRHAEQVYVAGAGGCLAAAIFLTYLLQNASKPVHLVNEVDQVLSMRSGDVLVAISFALHDRCLRESVRIGLARRTKIVAITHDARGRAACAADVRLLVHEANPFSVPSLAITMCLCQALVVAMCPGLTGQHGSSPRAQEHGPDPDEWS